MNRSRRLDLDRLEERVVMSVTIATTNNSGAGYAGMDFSQSSGGYVPPDTNGAAGPNAYVETVNQSVALYTSRATGATSVRTSLSSFYFTTGGLSRADGGSGLSDPIVTYNDQIGRFIVGDQDVNFSTHVSSFDIAVSTTSNPSTLTKTDWNFYKITTTESGYDADYPGNFGYNHDAFVFTLNMFGSLFHTQVVSVNNADLASGVSQAALHTYKNDLNDGSLRPVVMHDSVAGDPMWLLTEHGDNKSIDVIKMGGVLSTFATFNFTNLPVASYTRPVSPLNPNGAVITNNMDSRILKSAESKNVIVASHSVAVSTTEDDAQWYAVDVSSGTPKLKDQGRVGSGSNTFTYFPSVDINPSGQIGMTYIKSGKDTTTDYMSMYVTGRNATDTPGTMQTPIVVPAGKGVANYKDFTSGGRAGDLSGINVDPIDGSFWAVNEFATATGPSANWGTAIANFMISNPAPSTDMSVVLSGPSSVTAGTNATYTITITNNGPNAASGVVITDILPTGSNFVSITQTSGLNSFTLAQSSGSLTETSTTNIPSGASDSFTLVVAAPATLGNGAAFSDTAKVQATNPDPNLVNNSATVTGTILNTSPNADVSVSLSTLSSVSEGGTLTYTIKVSNAGPGSASTVVLKDTLASLFTYKSSTTSQGSVSVSGGVVTFAMGTIASGSGVTATIVVQATEDGSTSNSASVTSTTPDSNSANNSASVSTTVTEPSITVSGAITTISMTLSNFQVANFSHASGVESASSFIASINWGDGSKSTGTITSNGSTYLVSGSHTYKQLGVHTITTSVIESGNSPNELINKFGDNPALATPRERDIVQLPHPTRFSHHKKGHASVKVKTPLTNVNIAKISHHAASPMTKRKPR